MTYRRIMASEVQEDVVQLTGGPRLAVRTWDGPLRPILLVHDVGADSGSWTAVAERLNAAGHQVAAVDLRGHGRSQSPEHGYDTDTCADDLSTLLDLIGFTGGRSAVVAGHGWGANVVMSLAARRDGVAAVACLAGGWLRPAWRYPDLESCWAAYQAGSGIDDGALTGPDRERRYSIVRSLFFGEPRAWFPLIGVPAVLCPVVPPDGRADPAGDGSAARTGVAEANARLPRSRISWYYGSNPLADEPTRIADDLLALVSTAEPQID